MEITNKAALTALMKGCAKQDVRYYLNGIHFGPEKMSSTNGHMLMQVNYLDLDPSDYPFDNGKAPMCQGTSDVIIPAAAITAALRNCSKDKLPILDETIVVVKTDPKLVSLSSTDLEVTKVTKAKTIDGRYPDVEALMAPLTGDHTDVGVDPDLLIAAGQAAKALGAKCMKLSVVDANSAVRFEASTPEGQTLEGMIMPMRL